jgi:hypothetical protein
MKRGHYEESAYVDDMIVRLLFLVSQDKHLADLN